MTASYFTHLRAIRFAEDRLRLLREARAAYNAAMNAYLAQLDSEIARELDTLADAHTARGGDTCRQFPHPRRAQNN